MQTTQRGIAAMCQAIDALDFSRIKAKLMHRQDGVIALRQIESAEAGYRQFLKLAAKHPDAPLVPSKEVDEFWHMHILDTQRYSADCERIFGYMIHHDPYSGIDGAADEARHLALAAASDALNTGELAKAGGGAYCIKSAAKSDATAYCIKSAAKNDAAAYCIKSAVKSEGGAYCIKAARQGDAAAYCIKAAGKGDAAAYCIKPEARAASATTMQHAR